MKKLQFAFSIMSISLLLAGCSKKIDPSKIVARNGDLYALSDLTYENSLVDVSFEKMDYLINSNEKFVFYLYSHECSHCMDFKDVIFDYVKDTSTLVYRMDAIKDDGTFSDDFQALFDKYDPYFFIDHKVSFPQVYVVEGAKVAEQVPASRYAQKFMFKKAMSEYVTTSGLYHMNNFDGYSKFADERAKQKFATIIVNDREEYDNYYKDIKTSKIEVVSLFPNESNVDVIKQRFNIENLDCAYGIYSNKGELTIERLDSNQSSYSSFISKYL